MTQQVAEPLIQVHEQKPLGNKDISIRPHDHVTQSPMGPHPLPSMQCEDEIVQLFRRIHIYKPVRRIESLEEANKLLQRDENNAQANQYIGWWHLSNNLDGDTAVAFLKRAALSGAVVEVRIRKNKDANSLLQTISVLKLGIFLAGRIFCLGTISKHTTVYSRLCISL